MEVVYSLKTARDEPGLLELIRVRLIGQRPTREENIIKDKNFVGHRPTRTG